VHDLAVVDADPEVFKVDRTLNEQKLFSGVHPVVVVSRGLDTFRAERIIVAWEVLLQL
jgi:hypothetical protein